MSVIRKIKEWCGGHVWKVYAREGPYDDGHYWDYYECRYCGKLKIGPKRFVDTEDQ